MEKVKNSQNKMQQNKHLKKITFNIKLDLKNELKNILNKDNQYTIPIFIPHKGCKNECIFCNQRKISGHLTSVTTKDVDDEISKNLKYFENKRNDKKIQIAFFGGSFTGINFNEQVEYLKVANKYIKNGQVDSIRISTRPDYISTKILKMLKMYNVDTIELGVQSMDNYILTKAKRGHLRKEVIRASRLIKIFGINLGHQLMVGLPGSTIEKEIYSIKESLKLNPINLRIYPVYVIEPSELYDMYKNGEYIPLTLNDAIDRTVCIVKECQKTDIKIIRIGLQSTDVITENNKEIVGPVCDNFAEYVLSKIALEKLEKELNKILIEIEKEYKNNMIKTDLIISIPNSQASYISGPNKINKQYLENKFKKYNLKIKINSK